MIAASFAGGNVYYPILTMLGEPKSIEFSKESGDANPYNRGSMVDDL